MSLKHRENFYFFSERQQGGDWEEHHRPSGTEGPPCSMCHKAANPWDGISLSLQDHTTPGNISFVSDGAENVKD